jgi:hypothetical protein
MSKLLGKDLDRNIAAEARIVGEVDLAHPSGAQQGPDLIRPEAGLGRERHG